MLTLLLILSIYVQPYSTWMSKSERKVYREKARRMFYHGYNSYLEHAYPYDELKPISCTGMDTWGSYSLTLVDALDTLLIMGNTTEFERVAKLLTSSLSFDRDINVSVFETNIRVVGGLLSAHLLSHRSNLMLEEGWPCDGPLLRLAVDAAERLLPAFDTNTSMPYGTVNFKHGVPSGETPITCTASVGTFIVEFGTISYLTGDQRFITAARNALDGLWKRRSKIGLVGNHINVQSGEWTAIDAGIGAGVDSYFEYLVKGGIMFADPNLLDMLNDLSADIRKRLKYDDWYVWTNKDTGSITMPIFQSLEAYWPGVQVLKGDIGEASRTFYNYYQVFKQYGATPEFYQLGNNKVIAKREGYPLRPGMIRRTLFSQRTPMFHRVWVLSEDVDVKIQLIESAVYLYQATKDPFFLEAGRDILDAIESIAWTPCGYATVKNVESHELDDRMESFFLAETTKYLYLLFDENNFIHKSDGSQYTFSSDPADYNHFDKACLVGSSGYIFNTEAHPVDIAALYCCKHKPDESSSSTTNQIRPNRTLRGKDGCRRRPYHQKMYGLGSFIEDKYDIFEGKT